MVTTEDSPAEGAPDLGDEQMNDPEMVDPDNFNFSQYQLPMVTNHEEVQDDDDNEGNVSGAIHEWRAWPYNPHCHPYVYIKIAPYVSPPVEEKQY